MPPQHPRSKNVRTIVSIFLTGTGTEEVAAVICVEVQADLALDMYSLMSSVYLEDKHLFFLQVSHSIDYSFLSNKRRVANKRRVWKKHQNLINVGSGTNGGAWNFCKIKQRNC